MTSQTKSLPFSSKLIPETSTLRSLLESPIITDSNAKSFFSLSPFFRLSSEGVNSVVEIKKESLSPDYVTSEVPVCCPSKSEDPKLLNSSNIRGQRSTYSALNSALCDFKNEFVPLSPCDDGRETRRPLSIYANDLLLSRLKETGDMKEKLPSDNLDPFGSFRELKRSHSNIDVIGTINQSGLLAEEKKIMDKRRKLDKQTLIRCSRQDAPPLNPSINSPSLTCSSSLPQIGNSSFSMFESLADQSFPSHLENILNKNVMDSTSCLLASLFPVLNDKTCESNSNQRTVLGVLEDILDELREHEQKEKKRHSQLMIMMAELVRAIQ